MDIEGIKQKVFEICSNYIEYLENVDKTYDTLLSKLTGDSITDIEIICDIETEFHIDLIDVDISKVDTMRKIVNYINENQ